MTYFSSLILHMDLGYYFTRWRLSLNGKNIFDEKNVSAIYTNLMNKSISKGLISRNIPQKKYGILIMNNMALQLLMKVMNIPILLLKLKKLRLKDIIDSL